MGSCLLLPLSLGLAGTTRKGVGCVDELETSGFKALLLSQFPTSVETIPRFDGEYRLLCPGDGPSEDGDVGLPVPSEEVHWGGVQPDDRKSGITADNL